MTNHQIIAMVLLTLFYSAYLLKGLLQWKKGIWMNHLGKGEKSSYTIKIEKLLHLATILVIPVEIISILYDSVSWNQELLTRVGLALVGLGLVIFCIAMWQMRDNWRAGIPTSDATQLVVTGIYRWSRNPAFLGFDFTYLGILIAFYNPILAIITLWVIIMMHLQILEEERFLRDVFKQEYQIYCQTTGRYLMPIRREK